MLGYDLCIFFAFSCTIFYFRSSHKKLAICKTIDEIIEDDLVADYPGEIVNFKMKNIWESNQCDFCSAFIFKHESEGFCCLKGKIKLPLPDPPKVLKDLLKSNNNFRTNIRSYNNSLALASLGIDKKEIMNEGFSPSLKFQGTIYHNIGALKPNEGEQPKFAQHYIHDASMTADDEVAMRMKSANNTNLKPDIVKQLQEMLHIHNPYVKTFKVIV